MCLLPSPCSPPKQCIPTSHVPAGPSLLPSHTHSPTPAGSERIAKSEVAGQQLKEAQAINKSLSALGDVIASLQSKNGHVPYRNSKLTQVGVLLPVCCWCSVPVLLLVMDACRVWSAVCHSVSTAYTLLLC